MTETIRTHLEGIIERNGAHSADWDAAVAALDLLDNAERVTATGIRLPDGVFRIVPDHATIQAIKHHGERGTRDP